LGALGQRRVPLPADLLRGSGIARALTQFEEHYHTERNHRGKGSALLFPGADEVPKPRGPSVECRERLGGLLKYYHRRVA
jgi:hypothetical protein